MIESDWPRDRWAPEIRQAIFEAESRMIAAITRPKCEHEPEDNCDCVCDCYACRKQGPS